jgi:hypothetical protein
MADIKRCIARIPDNGDSYTCENQVLRGDYCANCLPHFYGKAWARFNAAIVELQHAALHVVELELPENQGAFYNLLNVALVGVLNTLKEKLR